MNTPGRETGPVRSWVLTPEFRDWDSRCQPQRWEKSRVDRGVCPALRFVGSFALFSVWPNAVHGAWDLP